MAAACYVVVGVVFLVFFALSLVVLFSDPKETSTTG